MRFHYVDRSTGKIVKTIESDNMDTVLLNMPSNSGYVECSDRSISDATHQYDFSTKGFTEYVKMVTVAELEETLLTAVDDIREDKQMELLTPGGAKSMVYAAKQQELLNYNTSGSTDPSLYPYASAEAEAGGESLADVMARWDQVISDNNWKIQRIEAIAIVAKRRIKDANTAAAKQQVFDQINWAWVPSA